MPSKTPLNRDPEPGQKRAPPPKAMCSTFCFCPLSVWLRCQLHPIKVFFARFQPITSSCTPKWLQYQLHHFQIHLCSMIRNTQQASAPHFLPGALFHLQNALNRDEKGHLMYSTPCFYPLSRWLRCQLHPMQVLFARCCPITSSCTPSLCPGLP